MTFWTQITSATSRQCRRARRAVHFVTLLTPHATWPSTPRTMVCNIHTYRWLSSSWMCSTVICAHPLRDGRLHHVFSLLYKSSMSVTHTMFAHFAWAPPIVRSRQLSWRGITVPRLLRNSFPATGGSGSREAPSLSCTPLSPNANGRSLPMIQLAACLRWTSKYVQCGFS